MATAASPGGGGGGGGGGVGGDVTRRSGHGHRGTPLQGSPAHRGGEGAGTVSAPPTEISVSVASSWQGNGLAKGEGECCLGYKG